MSPQELRALQKIHQVMLGLEKRPSHDGFTEDELKPLKQLLSAFAGHENLELRKISEIEKHLSSTMTLKHYVSWILPVERLLKKELRDDEFLIYSEDGSQNKSSNNTEKLPLVFVLDHLRSAFNVGSLFRTAECFQVEKIYLCGYTPLPTQDKLAKTAMGTDELVPWEEAPKTAELLQKLRDQGYKIVAFETTSHAKNLDDDFQKVPTAFLLGNERFGLDPEILGLCDEVRKIPLRGHKNSLNVGVAGAIATYEFSRQRGKAPL